MQNLYDFHKYSQNQKLIPGNCVTNIRKNDYSLVRQVTNALKRLYYFYVVC